LANAEEELLPRLIGRVFHVTCGVNLAGILQRSAVLTNDDGSLTTTFGSSANSFFRNRSCVPVFDYRSVSDSDLKESLMNCSPWQPADRCASHLAFLFLSTEASSKLRPWMEWKTTKSFSEMVVPYVEAGYPGPIPIEAIEEIVEVEFENGPEHPFLTALRAPPPPRPQGH